MNGLLEKYNEYNSIINYKIEYEFENGDRIDFKIKKKDFPHLIGLHKLIDIPIIRQFNDRNNKTVSANFIISKIKKEEYLTENIIKDSVFFGKISNRYEFFGKDNLLSISYTDAIINFNASKLGSTLNADYILFEEKTTGYNHLCLAENVKSGRYAETFFYEPSDKYLKNQKIVKVNGINIYDSKGEIYLSGSLSL